MPRIRTGYLKSVLYLYKTVEDAEIGRPNGGGTGFVVGVPSAVPNRQDHYYAVSNEHVAISGGASVIRLATKDGGTDIIETEPADWVKHPAGHDIAVLSLSLDPDRHDFVPIRIQDSWRMTYERGVGPGEDVFMIGRFVDYDGVAVNRPSVRFGNISSMPIKESPKSKFDHSYILDVHSRTGYSGSPVFVYRMSGGTFDGVLLRTNPKTRRLETDFSERWLMCLGIHWGQFPEEWELKDKDTLKEAEQSGLAPKGQTIKGMSGMTVAHPAWLIEELLDMARFEEQRQQADAKP